MVLLAVRDQTQPPLPTPIADPLFRLTYPLRTKANGNRTILVAPVVYPQFIRPLYFDDAPIFLISLYYPSLTLTSSAPKNEHRLGSEPAMLFLYFPLFITFMVKSFKLKHQKIPIL